MRTTGRLSDALLLLALLGVTVGASACERTSPSSAPSQGETSAAEDSKQAPESSEMAPRPFSSVELAQGNPRGRVFRLVQIEGDKRSEMEFDFIRSDASGATILIQSFDAQGKPAGDAQQLVTSWEELAAHADLPAAGTEIQDLGLELLGQQRPGRRYTWVGADEAGPMTLRMHYAMDLPGHPAVTEIERNGEVVLRAELTEDRRRLDPAFDCDERGTCLGQAELSREALVPLWSRLLEQVDAIEIAEGGCGLESPLPAPAYLEEEGLRIFLREDGTSNCAVVFRARVAGTHLERGGTSKDGRVVLEPGWQVGNAVSDLDQAPADFEEATPGPPLVRSLLGEALPAAFLPGEFRREHEQKLAEQRAQLKARPADLEAAIWVGRHLGYLGRYREAITHYSEMLDQRRWREEPRLLRHRGHRYLSVREIDKAREDLALAAKRVAKRPDRVEQDGLPNARNQPTSTLKTNIYYHLGLAHYLGRDFAAAAEAYTACLQLSDNPDMEAATRWWLFLSLSRAGQTQAASEVLDAVAPGWDIIENEAYYSLLLDAKGEAKEDQEVSAAAAVEGDSPSSAAARYGRAALSLVRGERDDAVTQFESIVRDSARSRGSWAAFGVLAAEAEIRRITAVGSTEPSRR